MSEPAKKMSPQSMQPESYQPRKPEIISMAEEAQENLHPQETLIETFDVGGAVVEVLDWRETIWCGKLAYGRKNNSEPNVERLLHSYLKLDNPKLTQSPSEPEWSVCVSLNYLSERPRGILFGMQVDTEEQPKVYDIYKVPSARFMRVLICEETAKALGVEMWHGGIPPYAWIGEHIAPQCGYRYGSDTLPVYEYYGYYDSETNRHKFCYLYVPVERMDEPESYQPHKPEIVSMAKAHEETAPRKNERFKDRLSEITLIDLPKAMMASYEVISSNPEQEGGEFIEAWLEKHGIKVGKNGVVRYGFDCHKGRKIPEGCRIYHQYVTLPEGAAIAGDNDVTIKEFPGGRFSRIAVRDPFSSDEFPQAWDVLLKWTFKKKIPNRLGCTSKKDCYSLFSNEESPCLEELYSENGVQYMAMYLPVE